MELEQKGIKWWKQCMACQWQGRARKQDNDNAECPNCGNPSLQVNVDKRVFDGRRYEFDVQGDRERDHAEAVRQNEGRQPAPPDTEDYANQGFRYGTGPKDTKKPVFKKRIPPPFQ